MLSLSLLYLFGCWGGNGNLVRSCKIIVLCSQLNAAFVCFLGKKVEMSFICIALASLNKKEKKGQISVLNYMHCSVIMSNISMSCSLWIKNATESINPIFVLMRLALKLYHELVETSLIAHSMFHFPQEEIALS